MANPVFDESQPFEKVNVQAQKPEFDPNQPFERVDAAEPGLGSKLLGLLGAASKKVDSVTGAPFRAGISAAQSSDQPSNIPSDFAKAFGKQFAESPEAAPSGEDIVKKGFGLEGTPAKVAGFGMDLAANPLNFVAPTASLVGKGVDAAKAIPLAGDVINAATEFPGKAAAYAVSKLPGAPTKQAIKIYAQDPGAVNDFVAAHGGELAAGADEMKQKLLGSVQGLKNELNGKITSAIDATAGGKQVSSQPLLEPLVKAQSAVNKHTNPADWAHIQNQIDTINAVAPNGSMDLKNLYDVKNYLQTQRYGNYQTSGGDLFQVANGAKRAAGQALDVARDTLHSEVPAIKDADSVFSKLHDIDNDMSASLLGTGKSENMFSSAGGATPGYANQHYSQLKELGDLTGTNPIQDAKTVYAAQQLNKHPSLTKEALKTLLTAKQGISNSNIPFPLISQAISSQTENPMGMPIFSTNGNSISRRLSSINQ